MAKTFTYYWTNRTWKKEKVPEEGTVVRYSSNLFMSRGVKQGDDLYIITVIRGTIFLAGRTAISRMWEESIEGYMGSEIIECIAPSMMSFERSVPVTVAEKLRRTGDKPLKFDSPTMLNVQTLRGVQELMPKSSTLFDQFLGY